MDSVSEKISPVSVRIAMAGLISPIIKIPALRQDNRFRSGRLSRCRSASSTNRRTFPSDLGRSPNTPDPHHGCHRLQELSGTRTRRLGRNTSAASSATTVVSARRTNRRPVYRDGVCRPFQAAGTSRITPLISQKSSVEVRQLPLSPATAPLTSPPAYRARCKARRKARGVSPVRP
jgi:hypothetical protein